MSIENMRLAKCNISIHTSNSFTDCDNMFIPDFIELDQQLVKHLEEKQEEKVNLLDHFSEMGHL